MRKKLIILIIIFVSIIVVKLMLETTEKADEQISITSHSVPSKSNDLSDIKNESAVNERAAEELTAFQDELNRHYKNLPTLGDLKNLTAEEVHHTPEIITEGGGIIGRVFDKAEKDFKKRPDAMTFFKKCAEDQEIAIAIRASCLNKVLNLVPQWKIPMTVTDEEISKEVFELALKLPR